MRLINPYRFGGLKSIPFLLSEVVALRSTATRVNVGNYFADAFYDQNGIDLTASLNESYNSTDDYYEGTLSSSSSWDNNASGAAQNADTYSAFGVGASGCNFRIPMAASDISTSGNSIAITLSAYTGQTYSFANAYIAEKAASGNDWDYTGSLTELKFNGGSSGGTVTGGSTLTSDVTTFALDETKSYIIIIRQAGSNGNPGYYNGGGRVGYYKSGANESSTAAPSGYSTAPYNGLLLKELLVYTRSNLDLKTNAYTAPSVPTKMNVLALYNAIDSITLGTDWQLQVTRNDGTNWTNVTLTAGGASGIAGYNYAYGEADISGQPSGTNMRARILTSNNKNVRDAAVAGSYA